MSFTNVNLSLAGVERRLEKCQITRDFHGRILFLVIKLHGLLSNYVSERCGAFETHGNNVIIYFPLKSLAARDFPANSKTYVRLLLEPI